MPEQGLLEGTIPPANEVRERLVRTATEVLLLKQLLRVAEDRERREKQLRETASGEGRRHAR